MADRQTNTNAPKRIRTCISCGSQGNKGTLYRLVRTSEGSVRFDGTGKVSGRGAYVCGMDCLLKACKGGKLARALRCTVNAEDGEMAVQELQRFLDQA